ncbi:MAG: thiol-disulfide oxidoreductase DCC family protein [Verrucomicrobiales bacterium]
MNTAHPIVFFDGDCLFCQSQVRLLHRLDRHDRLRFAPLQGDTARLFPALEPLRTQAEPDTVAFVSPDLDGAATRARAVLLILRRLGGFWALASRLLALIPLPLLDRLYDLIARHRKRLRNKACPLPEPTLQAKILP